jgi:hypothetical protein
MTTQRVCTSTLLLAAACLASAGSSAGVLAAQTFTATKTNIGGEGGHDYITAEPGTGRVRT